MVSNTLIKQNLQQVAVRKRGGASPDCTRSSQASHAACSAAHWLPDSAAGASDGLTPTAAHRSATSDGDTPWKARTQPAARLGTRF